MVIQLLAQELDLFYRRAKESYLACVNHPANGYLQDQVAVPLTGIDLRQITVKVVFEARDPSTYQFEVLLALFANEASDASFGKYECVMDEQGTVTANELVFY